MGFDRVDQPKGCLASSLPVLALVELKGFEEHVRRGQRDFGKLFSKGLVAPEVFHILGDIKYPVSQGHEPKSPE